MSADNVTWVTRSYACAITAQIAFGAYAIYYTRRIRQGLQPPGSCTGRSFSSAEGFVTARGTQGCWRLAWSLFAGAMGAWAVTGPAAYAVHAGERAPDPTSPGSTRRPHQTPPPKN